MILKSQFQRLFNIKIAMRKFPAVDGLPKLKSTGPAGKAFGKKSSRWRREGSQKS